MGSEAADWLNLYEATEQALIGLESDLREQSKNPTAVTTKEKRVIARRINNAKEDVSKLERSLAKMEAQPLAYKIGEGELSRRRGMMTRLKNTTTTVDDLHQGKIGRKKELLKGGRENEEYKETEETQKLDNHQLADQQQSQIEKQDEQLSQVLDGVTKLKHMGQDINNELDLHKHLLSDLDDAIDKTDERVKLNTQRVDTINEKAGGCCGMIVMVVLLILIVVLLSSNVGCHVFAPSRC